MPVFERNCPALTPRTDVYKVIDGERAYQQNLPPNRSEDPNRRRTVAEYLTMLDYYVRHAQDAWTMRAGVELPLHDMRKIAALAVRCMEEWGALPREGAKTFLKCGYQSFQDGSIHFCGTETPQGGYCEKHQAGTNN